MQQVAANDYSHLGGQECGPVQGRLAVRVLPGGADTVSMLNHSPLSD